MSTDLKIARDTVNTYAAPVSRDVLLAQALGHILAGRPLPESLQPPTRIGRRPASIAQLLAGPGGAA